MHRVDKIYYQKPPLELMIGALNSGRKVVHRQKK